MGEQCVSGCARVLGASELPTPLPYVLWAGLWGSCKGLMPSSLWEQWEAIWRARLARGPGKPSRSPLHSPPHSETRGPTALRTPAPAAPRGSPAWWRAAVRRPRAERQLLQGGLHLLTFAPDPRTGPQPRAPHRVNNSHSEHPLFDPQCASHLPLDSACYTYSGQRHASGAMKKVQEGAYNIKFSGTC